MMRVTRPVLIIYFLCVLLSSNVHGQSGGTVLKDVKFTEGKDVISLEQRSRRKFTNALIADLDQNGYLDLLLTEHARKVEVYWNEAGIFTKGKSFIAGDTHGLAAADYDRDGNIEVLVQPGGGGGKKPSQTIVYKVYPNRNIGKPDTLKHFKSSRGRAVKLIDIDHNGTLDLVASSFPKMSALEKANFLYTNSDKTKFEFDQYLPYGDRFGYRVALTDFNNDKRNDVIFYGRDEVVFAQAGQGGKFENVNNTVIRDSFNLTMVTSISEIDFDNDGDMDLFLTRSKLPFASESDYDKERSRFYFFDRNTSFLYDSILVEGNLKIENLQMAYPDFDVYLGSTKKLFKRKQDRHGQQDLVITKKEAKGWSDDTSANGLYIAYLGNDYWRIGGKTNSPTSAVLHHVKKSPKTKAKPLAKLPAQLLENRGGTYVQATERLQINIDEQTSSSAVGDFNNDGWSDIFVVKYGKSASENEHIVLLNNAGKYFTPSQTHGVVSKELGATGGGAETFDFDKDGDLDIVYSNERGRWHLFINEANDDNNYIVIDIGNSPTDRALPNGAVLEINACGSTYKRKVGATSSSYSHSLNTYLHVGLGTCAIIDKATVTWSTNEQVELEIKQVNQIYKTSDFNSRQRK